MSAPSTRALAIAMVLCAVTACRGDRPDPSAAPEAAPFTFAIDGRSNSAPAVAGWGRIAAVVWSASTDAQSDIYISVSGDSGRTFAPAVRVNDVDGDARASGEQAARVVIGTGNVIHVAWPSRRDGGTVIRYASSTDGGQSFSKAKSVAGEGEGGARGWHALTLGYDGGVHAVWLDGRNAAPVAKRAAAPTPRGSGGHKHGASRGPAPRQDIFHAAWKGETARSERAIAGNVCFCCKTAVATAGDRVYAAWRHIYPGSVRDIAVARSTDNGATFGPPMRVSEDGWTIAGCPDDGPSMAADSHGGIHIAWPTLAAGETPRKAIYYSSLIDERAFAPRVRLDSGDTDPAHPQLAADLHGTSAVVWDERTDKGRRIVFRTVAHGEAGAPKMFDGEGASYPAIAATDDHWIVAWATQTGDGRTTIEGRQIPFK
jgi:hypothetical protein